MKVDAKTKSLLDEHKMKKKNAENGSRKDLETEEGEAKGSDDDDDDDVGETALQEDEITKNGLTAIMQEFADDLSKDPPGGETITALLFIYYLLIVPNFSALTLLLGRQESGP